MDNQIYFNWCEMCGDPMYEHTGDCCSEECAQAWVDKYLSAENLQQDDDI